MFFDSWMGLLRVLIIGVLAYCGVILLQRLTGKRTLSKMNAFDLIVTVALGSGLATVILSKDVALVEGLAAFIILMGLQYVVTWLSVRSASFSRMIKAEPQMLYYRNQYLHQVMQKQRVVEAEIHQAVRSAGLASFDDVEAVVLETDGTFSVIKRAADRQPSALSDVHPSPGERS